VKRIAGLTALSAAALAFLAVAGRADEPGRAADKHTVIRGTVANVRPDDGKLTVKTRRGQEVVVQVDDQTRLRGRGGAVKLSQLKEGDHVRVRFRGRNGSRHAVAVVRLPVHADDARREVREALQSAKSYTIKRKDEYQRKLRDVLDDMDERIDDLQEQAESANGTAQKEAQAKLRELRAKRDVVRDRLQKVNAATADTWDRVTGAVSDAVQDFQKMYDDVRSHFDK
jgi:vacuolar-type H+-ATPase subunit I/STV1